MLWPPSTLGLIRKKLFVGVAHKKSGIKHEKAHTGKKERDEKELGGRPMLSFSGFGTLIFQGS